MYPRRSCEHKIGNLPDANSRIFAKNSVSVWQTPVFRDHIGAWASGNLSRLILDDFNVFWLFGVFLRRSIKAQTSHFQWNRLCEITNVEQSIISIWFPAKKYSDGSCFGYWCFPNNFRWSVMWRLTVCAIRIHFISLWILCDSMWNSMWFYVKISLRNGVLMIVVSDLYTSQTSSGALRSGDPSGVASDTSIRYFTLNSMWFYVKFRVKIFFRSEAKEWCRDSCFVSLCFPEKFRCSVMWRLTVCAKITSLWISHRIT